eukprot:comp22304_c0_seq1/m.53396 comp22304_c0_seq1/g.53396  ORF comp22304_c0_seq1/g.53396 comp22304_c0_seq1/m.53396 type:complete len:326 (+) comp22304_c0_seq1:1025-2002(+)
MLRINTLVQRPPRHQGAVEIDPGRAWALAELRNTILHPCPLVPELRKNRLFGLFLGRGRKCPRSHRPRTHCAGERECMECGRKQTRSAGNSGVRESTSSRGRGGLAARKRCADFGCLDPIAARRFGCWGSTNERNTAAGHQQCRRPAESAAGAADDEALLFRRCRRPGSLASPLCCCCCCRKNLMMMLRLLIMRVVAKVIMMTAVHVAQMMAAIAIHSRCASVPHSRDLSNHKSGSSGIVLLIIMMMIKRVMMMMICVLFNVLIVLQWIWKSVSFLLMLIFLNQFNLRQWHIALHHLTHKLLVIQLHHVENPFFCFISHIHWNNR